MMSLTSFYSFGLIFLRHASVIFRNVAMYLHLVVNRVRSHTSGRGRLDLGGKVIEQDDPFIVPANSTLWSEVTCPYEYILRIYGPNHFSKFIDTLKPDLRLQDPVLFGLALEVMDAVHFGAILVDDIADHSLLRKGEPSAHRLYGSSETINRAYLRILEIVNKCHVQRPSLVPYILTNLEQIHKGQDISLVWRRDGFEDYTDQESALKAYRQSAHLKTGALFRLLGQLVYGSHEKDALMSQVGWYCHLQNDCKNVYSSDVVAAKGALAEDLTNREFSFPIVVALYGSPTSQRIMREAMGRRSHLSQQALEKQHCAALSVLQADEIKTVCMQELDLLKDRVSQFVTAWGRAEMMTVKLSKTD